MSSQRELEEEALQRQMQGWGWQGRQPGQGRPDVDDNGNLIPTIPIEPQTQMNNPNDMQYAGLFEDMGLPSLPPMPTAPRTTTPPPPPPAPAKITAMLEMLRSLPPEILAQIAQGGDPMAPTPKPDRPYPPMPTYPGKQPV